MYLISRTRQNFEGSEFNIRLKVVNGAVGVTSQLESDKEVRLFTVLNFRMGCCSKFRSLLIANSQHSGSSCILK
jgi:hypothetical protein